MEPITTRPLTKQRVGQTRDAFCIKSVRRPNELIFEHTYIVTTLSDNVNAQTVFSIYQTSVVRWKIILKKLRMVSLWAKRTV